MRPMVPEPGSEPKGGASGIGAESGADRPWIVGRVAAPPPRVRLFCLPQAGGSAATYAPWRLTPPDGVELATVELPGRGSRTGEDLPDTLEELADAVIDGIRSEIVTPYAFFGHSFGALLGYEITVRLARRGLPAPCGLLVSAARAPHAPPASRISTRDDAGLRSWLDSFGGIPPELSRFPAYLEFALGTVRRDLALVEDYAATNAEPVNCPLHIFGGVDDPLVSAAQLDQWRECSPAAPPVRQFPGGHGYLFTDPLPVVAAVRDALAPFADHPPEYGFRPRSITAGS